VLLLVPVFAFFVRLFFWRREYSYGDYLVFSFHFNSFVFLLFTLGVVWEEIIFPGTDVVMVLFVTQILYLGVALRRV
jgi:hypothetical protein